RCELDEASDDDMLAAESPQGSDGPSPANRATHSYAADSGPVTHTNLVEAGHSALLLDLNGIVSDPGALDGIGVGYRYAASDTLHVRLAMGLDNFGSETERENQGDSSLESSIFTVAGGPEFILRRNENLALYAGGLAQLSLSADENEDLDTETDGTGFTLAAVVGVNWFPTRRLSLTAEYRFGLVHTSITEENGLDVETTTLQVGTGSTAFMLGFWF
ncbi:MAG: outer membrane beta-barrel protein, partial [Myxococcota bacterium]|nr:outer membrane beta-barrel protein [Myxococcota bacterium]